MFLVIHDYPNPADNECADVRYMLCDAENAAMGIYRRIENKEGHRVYVVDEDTYAVVGWDSSKDKLTKKTTTYQALGKEKTAKEWADFLNVPIKTIWRWAKDGRLEENIERYQVAQIQR